LRHIANDARRAAVDGAVIAIQRDQLAFSQRLLTQAHLAAIARGGGSEAGT